MEKNRNIFPIEMRIIRRIYRNKITGDVGNIHHLPTLNSIINTNTHVWILFDYTIG